ncbi:major facilitator superfamily domain-containing protein, partial [Mycena galopus ATCC 62051]
MLNRLIPKIGFGWTVRIIALIVFVCFAVASLTIKTRRPPKPLPPLSKILAFHAFRDLRYAFLCLGGWFTVFSTFNPFFYVGIYGAVANGGATTLTPYFLAIMCATAIVGRILPGYIADRFGRFNVIALSTLLSGILILALWYTSTAQPNLIAFSAVYGFASGPFFSLVTACAAQISPVQEVGARVGMIFFAMATGALAGTPIGGVFIKDPTVPNFKHLILFSEYGISGLGFLLCRPADAVAETLGCCI